MIRVLYLAHTSQQSGGEIALARLLAALKDSEVRPFVVLAEYGEMEEMLRSTGAQVDVLPVNRKLLEVRKDSLRTPAAGLGQVAAVLTYSWRLRKYAKDRSIDLVHANSLKSGVYGGLTALSLRLPLVWHLRDRLSPDYLPRYAIAFVKVAIALLAKRVVCNSQSTLETLTQGSLGYFSERARAISSPLPDIFEAKTNRVVVAKGPTPAGLRFAMVGRIAPWKGQDVVLDAFSRANLGDSSLTFIGAPMFGETEFADHLKKLHHASEVSSRIHFIGFMSNVAASLEDFDVLVHASISPEPFGQVIVEGLASGLAVLATDAGGPAEIITHELSGLLYPPGDTSALARAMERLYDEPDLRERLGRAGLNRAHDFLPEKITHQVIDVYRACIRS